MMECGIMAKRKVKESCISLMVQCKRESGLMAIYKEKVSSNSKIKVSTEASLLEEISMGMEHSIKMMVSFSKASGLIKKKMVSLL